MSRNGDELQLARGAGRNGSAGPPGRPRLSRLALTSTVLALLVTAPSSGQGVPATPAPELTPRVQESLLHLQEGWLQWTSALYGGDPERAREVLEDLLATAGHLGMRRLPDFSTGALVQAVEAARDGEPARATFALEAAEQLDPGRPETAFVAGKLARLAGDWPGATLDELRAYLRIVRMGLEWKLTLHDLFLWLLASLLLAGALFVALQMTVRGPALFRDLAGFLGRRTSLPRPIVLAGTVVVLLWPAALPAGVFWLVLYWSLLLWGYLGVPERVVVVAGWVLLASTPVLVEQTRERIALQLSPPVRALDSAARGRLYGGLFTDLGVLLGALPDDPAVDHFLADLNVRLGQWEEARLQYEDVLAEEPENVAALVNLGAYYFHRGDYGNAVARFQEAAALPGAERAVGAAAQFDLSVAYLASYLFDEHREALVEARRIDDLQVTRWLRRPERQRIVTVEGGMERIPEIERALRREWGARIGAAPGLELLRRARPALAIVLLASLALVFHGVTGRARRAAGDTAALRSGRGRWLPTIVPGLPSAAHGHGVRAYLALFLVAAPAVALIAVRGRLGYPLPWHYDPDGWLLSVLAVLALTLVLGLRALRVARSG